MLGAIVLYLGFQLDLSHHHWTPERITLETIGKIKIYKDKTSWAEL